MCKTDKKTRNYIFFLRATKAEKIEKKSDNFFAARRNNTAQRKKGKSCTSKRRKKQAHYFEINRILTVSV